MSEALVILCTCPDDETAACLARELVAKRLAACVNVLPGIRSIYRWQESIEQATEVLMVIKTMAAVRPELERWLQAEHPYDVPEIVALSADHVAPAYLDWLSGQVSDPRAS